MILTARDLSWLQVSEVTQDPQVLMGSQEAEASRETLAPWGPQAHLLEMKVMEFCSIRRYLVSGVGMDQQALLATHVAFLWVHPSFTWSSLSY